MPRYFSRKRSSNSYVINGRGGGHSTGNRRRRRDPTLYDEELAQAIIRDYTEIGRLYGDAIDELEALDESIRMVPEEERPRLLAMVSNVEQDADDLSIELERLFRQLEILNRQLTIPFPLPVMRHIRFDTRGVSNIDYPEAEAEVEADVYATDVRLVEETENSENIGRGFKRKKR